ncbi:MAG: hypothetical protein KBE65_02085 [Phycisphaerae bacterium]|nr:hypothetical protein [Phycisphaerae bacterium]
MRKLTILAAAFVLMGLCMPVSAQVVFSENFDSYAAGTALHGKGGWKGWNNDAAAGAPTSSDYAYSGKNSVKITGATDLVHEFTIAGGVCEFATMQYIPVGSTGSTFFILLNRYDDAGATNNWSIQLNYNLDTGIITAESESSATTEVIFGRWVELKFHIDLEKNTCDWYYAGELIATHPWDSDGSMTLQAVDLYANNADPVYYDDITVTHEQNYKAGSPDPADGFVGVTMPLLQWSKGYLGYFHNVYFGTSPELTEANLVSSKTPSTLFYYFMGIDAGVTYYWRVDEVEIDGTTVHTGDVWNFTAMPLTAYYPSPADGSEGIVPFTTLSWQAPSEDATHRLYLGDDMDAVQAGDAAVDKGTTTETSFDTGYLRSGATYYWRVDEVGKDGSVQAGDVWSFTTFLPVDNQAVREWWMDIGSSTAVAGLTDNPLYPNSPTGRKLVDYMEGPVGWAENYGTRLYGWLKPDKTGAYTFWISSDDMSELWLSTNDDPAKAAKIASVTGWTNSQDWDNGSGQGGTLQKSAAINLTAGQKYFIQALQKEGGGGDNIAVAWQPPNGARELLSAQFVDTYGLLPLTAAVPSPENGAVNTLQSLELAWLAGEKAVKHDVYFGDDAAAVAAADTASALYQGSQSGTTFDTGDLEWGKTYYWRVDEVAEGDVDSPWKGGVWSFTTADFIPVDDFESYDDDENHLYDTWIDGLTNNTGSYVGYETATNGTFGETVRVHSGGQSMPIAFDNTKSPYYSEVSRTLAPVQNWTAGGVTALSLFVRGKTAGDLGVVYVALEDSAGKSAVVSYPDDTAAVSGAWIEWTIPLSSFSGVNPAKIKTVYIGVGNRTTPVTGGTGSIYVDDIRVVK